ncbi:nuclease-related domain-containing protein [Cytobacillus kochii]|uniref:nuclease-related domain-containing protein n=1 Tax=Cytobacillus kochii TaxID=859143 RepID=UPI002480AF19|nr:nuclease-related domain-containing protein [Cytobacillus kochii]
MERNDSGILIGYNFGKERMMFLTVYKPLEASTTLRFYRAIHTRTELPPESAYYLQSLQKGYNGEKNWATYLNELPENIPILYDLQFEVNQSTIQIDALCILQNKLVLFEVKNFQGNFSVDGDKWYSPSHKEMKNPLNQIKRAEPIFHQFLKKHQLNIPFDYYLIFVHPTFILYGASHQEQLILPGQIPEFLDGLKQQTFSPQRMHTKIIDTLLTNHKNGIHLLHKPQYHFDQMVKGLFCGVCGEKMNRTHKMIFSCSGCHHPTSVNNIVLCNIQDYMTLFPERKVTTASIFEWVGGEVSANAIKKILYNNFERTGKGKSTHYIKTDK